MKKENIEFLENLKKELLTQDNMATRDVMYAIQDEKEIFGFDPNRCFKYVLEYKNEGIIYRFSTISEIFKILAFSNDTKSKLKELYDKDLKGAKYILEDAGYDIALVGVKTEDIFELDNGEAVFFSKEAAKEYLQENYYRYNNASIYGISAYNNPEMCKLREIIMNTDWNNLDISKENKTDLRSITLRDDEGQGDLYVETNAPKEIIQEALMYRDELRERNQMETTDYEVIQEYINKKGYVFKEADEDEEVYIW